MSIFGIQLAGAFLLGVIFTLIFGGTALTFWKRNGRKNGAC